MKTKLLLSLLLSFVFGLLSSQVPQGFNYQAIARDGSGNILANQALPVKIDIQTSLTGGSLIYEELFASVTSNQFGLISLVVGTGTQTGGSAASFSAIDWKAQTLFLKTIIQYPGTTWTTMGTSQIWAVPYSLVAKDVAGPLTKLGIAGTTDNMEEALFEVRNKAGNIVFAVYNEGIRAYVGNGDAKGARGGFSVGGYDATKGSPYDLFVLNTDSARFYIDSKPNLKGKKGGFSVGGYDMTKDGIPVQNYLEVSKDSVRIYIDSNPLTKGKKGGFAVGGYDMTKGTNENYLNVNTDASGIIKPVNRILWYPLKNAFLAGNIRIGTPDSVGVNSFATGYRSKSRGMYSQAMGYKAIANGDYSTAIGKNAVAGNTNSFAFGDGASVLNNDSYSIGAGAIAQGIGSYAIGSAGRDTLGNLTGTMTLAAADYSFAIGQGSVASNIAAFALGSNTTASGSGSLAMGIFTTASENGSTAMSYGTISQGIFSTAMGSWTIASGFCSTALGNTSQATGNSSTAMGNYTYAIGINSTAMGEFTHATEYCSTSMGFHTNATEIYSTAMGFNTTANGRGATTMGQYTRASGHYSVAIGDNTLAKPYASLAIGQYNDTTCSPGGKWGWFPIDPLFIIGNGTASARSNAVTVLKNGNVGIGTSTPTYKLHVNGSVAGVGAYINLSDIRFKKDIEPITGALEKIIALHGITFNWDNKADSDFNFDDRNHIGFSAQDLEKIVPQVVSTANDKMQTKSVAYGDLVPLLTEGIKEQQKQIEGQQQQIESTKQENQQLKSEIEELKTLVNKLIASQTAQVNKQ